MAKLSLNQVKHIAHLANLKLSPDEEQAHAVQLTKIINFMTQLEEVETENVEPLFSPAEVKNVFCEKDEPNPAESLTQEQALKNAKSTDNGMFVVPSVLNRTV